VNRTKSAAAPIFKQTLSEQIKQPNIVNKNTVVKFTRKQATPRLYALPAQNTYQFIIYSRTIKHRKCQKILKKLKS